MSLRPETHIQSKYGLIVATSYRLETQTAIAIRGIQV